MELLNNHLVGFAICLVQGTGWIMVATFPLSRHSLDNVLTILDLPVGIGWIPCQREQRRPSGETRPQVPVCTPVLKSHLAKYRSLLPKLALIFHLADDDRMHPEIPLAQVERAAEFCSYLEAHARRIYGSVASLPH